MIRHEQLTLDPVLASVPVGRHFVRALFQDGGIGAPLAEDAELITSELVTNAVEHGGQHSVLLSVQVYVSCLKLSVTSRGNADQLAPDRQWEIAEVDSITGRGLGIVSALADQVQVDRSGDEVTITVELRTGLNLS